MKKKSHSLNRIHLSAFLAKHTLNGSIVDLGGSKNASYHANIKGDHTFYVLGIDKRYGYDLFCDLEKEIPLESNSFDHALILNLLEHIYNYKTTLKELNRIVRPGGTILHYTPFLYREHGCPNDFYRYTKETLYRLYSEHGFTVEEVIPIAAGVFTCTYQLTNFLVPTNFAKSIYRSSMEFSEKTMRKYVKRYNNIADDFPLSYAVVAKKK